jgi:hypothetical protein
MSDNEIFKRLSIDEMSWLSEAACRKEEIVEADLFFATRRVFAREAIKICEKCPVQEKCLNYALRVPHSEDYYGVMGATTRIERKKLR